MGPRFNTINVLWMTIKNWQSAGDTDVHFGRRKQLHSSILVKSVFYSYCRASVAFVRIRRLPFARAARRVLGNPRGFAASMSTPVSLMPRAARRGGSAVLVAVASALAVKSSVALVGSFKHLTFEWMQWAPPAESVLQHVLDTHFPHALPSGAVVPAIRKHLDPLGVVPGCTLFGQSVCSDEINHGKEDLTSEMVRYWSNVFPLGGIGGAPFVGKTGFGAFSGHVPDAGHIFILFGPHVGISPQGEVGKYHRKGQAKASGACGALIGGYTMLVNGNPIEAGDLSDMEEGWLCRKLAPSVDTITSSENPMVTLVKEAYNIIEEEVLKIVHTKFGTGKLVLLGGIQINMPGPYQDHFQVRHFSARAEGVEPVDLLKDFINADID